MRPLRAALALAALGLAVAPGGAAAARLELERLPAAGTGAGPLVPLVADIDGDGAADVVTPNFAGNSVSVLAGRGDGTFDAKEDFPAGPGPTSITGGDLRSGLGRFDLAVGNYGAGYSLLDRGADGTYQKRGAANTATVAVPVGIFDIAAVTATSPEIELILAGYSGGGALGYGSTLCTQDDIELPPFHCPGVFGGPSLVSLGGFGAPPAMALTFSAGDLEGAVVDTVGQGIRRGRLDTSAFPTWVPVGSLIPAGRGVIDVEAGDMDGDGDGDYVTADTGDDSASLLLRDGAGGFTRSVVAAGCDGPTDVVLGDVDRSGANDIVLACTTGELQVHLNRGDGTFAPGPVLRGDGVAFAAAALADIDGDRGLDVLGVSRAGASVTPFRSSPAPTVAPTRLAFPERDALTQSGAVAVQVGDLGSGDVKVTGAALSGRDASSFTLVANGCAGAGGAPLPVGPGETCLLAVRFAPRALGRLSATLEVTLARGGPLRVAVTGIGVQPGKPRVTRVVAGPAPRRRGARVAFALSRAAKVVVTLQRRVGSRLVRVAKAERARAFGPSAIVLGPRLGVGRYRVTVRARDARGRTSATVVRTFRLR